MLIIKSICNSNAWQFYFEIYSFVEFNNNDLITGEGLMEPKFTITNEILKLCEDIFLMLGKYEGLSLPAPKPELRKHTKIIRPLIPYKRPMVLIFVNWSINLSGIK